MHGYKQLYTKLYSKNKSKRMPKGESICFYIILFFFLNLCLKLFHVFVCVYAGVYDTIWKPEENIWE